MDFPLAFTFDDVLLKPGYAGFLRSEIDLSTNLTKKIKLKVPIVSSPMDTVTDAKLAVALAAQGGIGFIHRNLTVSQQASAVAKVKKKGLLVGAAVGSSPGFEKRVDGLVSAGADVILVDSAHGYAKQVINTVKKIRKSHKNIEIIAGNVATTEGALALIQAGTSTLRVGMGPGAICSTRIISGMGVPQLTAIKEISKVARRYKIPVIADGGINYSGDIVKALAAGASTVMLGRIFAGTQEAPGEKVQLKSSQVPSRFQSILNGAKTHTFKSYRGMGSIAAMKEGMKISSEDEFHGKSYGSGDELIAEGVEGLVPVTSNVAEIVNQLVGGLYSGFYYLGAKNIQELWRKSHFIRVTQASLTESHPHNLFITNPGKNYH
jgi:IMP dehydrogenase